MFHPKWQKIPRHGGSFAAFFKPRMQCSRQKIQELRQMLQHELVQSPVGEIFLPEVWMSLLNLLGWAQEKNLSVLFLLGRVWGGLVERNGLLRAEAIWKQIANSREKGTSSGRGQALQCVAYNGKFKNLHSICPMFWNNLHFNNPTTESP